MGNAHIFEVITPEQIKSLAERTKLSEDKIIENYEAYQGMAILGNGKVTEDVFASVCGKSKMGRMFAHQLFRVFDTDGNNSVSFEEFLIGDTLLNSTDVRETAKLVFKILDLNQDGRLSYAEMEKISFAFKRMNDENRHKSDAELRKEVQRSIRDMMAECDKDRNGYLSDDEFLSAFMNNSEAKNIFGKIFE